MPLFPLQEDFPKNPSFQNAPTSCFIAEQVALGYNLSFTEILILLWLIPSETSIKLLESTSPRPFMYMVLFNSHTHHLRKVRKEAITYAHGLRTVLLFQDLPKVRQLVSGS